MPERSDRLWVDSMADCYERVLVPTVFQPFASVLADRLLQGSPSRILELAAGTGVLTREVLALAPEVRVTATDLNEAMVRYGRATVPEATWATADAMRLPFQDATLEVVACQFGAMFFPDRVAAFKEAGRVLAPGGRVTLSVWDALETHDFESVVTEAMRTFFPDDPPLFLAEVPHGCHDANQIVAALAAAGWASVVCDTITVTGRAESVAELARGYCEGTPLRAAILARGDLEETSVRLVDEMVNRLGAGPVEGRMGAHIFEAVWPG